MKKRKISFLISIIVVMFIVAFAVMIGIFVWSFNQSDTESSRSVDNYLADNHSAVLTEGLEINIERRGNKVSASLNQSSYTLLYTVAYQNSSCPDYGSGDNVWSEQELVGETIAISPIDERICYVAAENSENFFEYEYAIKNGLDQEVDEFAAAESENLIILLIALVINLPFVAYMAYWLVQTKAELKARGATEIPSTWLFIVPVAHIYYMYKYAEGAEKVTKGKVSLILVFLLYLFTTPFIIMPICQNYYNKTD